MADLKKPAYQGRPDPENIANRFMTILIILLILGFIRAGIDNKWFDAAIRFIES